MDKDKVTLEIIKYIEEHMTENIKLDDIAKFAGYSKFHVNRVFTNNTGITIHQYIKNRRLSKAAAQLTNTDRTILDIALDSGYETPQSFHLAFKNRYRESPLHYRQKNLFCNFIMERLVA